MDDIGREIYNLIREAAGDGKVVRFPKTPKAGQAAAPRRWRHTLAAGAALVLLTLPVSFDLTQDQCPPQATAPAPSLTQPPAACATPPEGSLFGFRGCATLSH